MKKKTFFGLALALFLMSHSMVFGASFDTVVVFGDSLSDNGNLYTASGNIQPDPTEYWQGRFSNNEVWVEYLADAVLLNATLVDNAWGGALTGTAAMPMGMNAQVTQYTGSATLGANTLFVIWIGANDLMAITDPADASAVIAAAIANISTALNDLATFGAEYILILNLPDIGATPGYSGTANAAAATLAAQTFNTSLATTVSTFKTANPDITVYDLDIYTLFNALIADPAAYGFTNSTAVSPNFAVANTWDNSAGYVFWDTIHPTTEAHEVIAEQANDRIDEIDAANNPNNGDDDDDDDSNCFIDTLISVGF